ncbi:coiled-coil domain-containing protein 142 isoform X3 [Eleutherodactylus coqui]|uniref:coiled-coil domain-containing protein 142 isoform X3 n=1 Tax=Eleutherodactylus coqui TaxID=57060 RepID=UPI003462AB56
MRRREAPWSYPRDGFLQGSASTARFPVLPQSAELRCDVISEGEELTHSAVGRHEASLLFLRRQRHLLTLTREFVVLRMQALEFCRRAERAPLCALEAVCLRLQVLCHTGTSLQRRLGTNHLLRPLSPAVRRALESMRRALQLMTEKAASVMEELMLRAVRGAAAVPAEVPGTVCRALILYNKVLAEVSPWAAPWKAVRLMTITTSLEIVAEERAWLLARYVSQAGLRYRLEEVLQGEAESPEVGGALWSHLETLVREDQRRDAPLLKVLAGLDHMVRSSEERRSLYERYCSHLWALLCTQLFQALYPGRRGAQVMPALSAYAAKTTAVTQLLHGALLSDAVPGASQQPLRRLCEHLLHTAALIAWDAGMCRALSSALTDKCVTSCLDDGARQTHSRTSAAIVTVCQELSQLLPALRSGTFSGQRGVLGRCVASLQLCDLWLRSRSQVYASSGSLSHLLLISHGDLPVIKEQIRGVASAADHVEWCPVSRRLWIRLQNTAESLEDAALCLPRLLGAVCARRTQDIFRHMMPVGRHWRGKVESGPDLVPSEYARAAVNAVLVPLLQAVGALSPEEQVPALSATVGVFMEAWMEHILREKLRFSLQGALQLRCDFESVRELLKSQECGVSPEVVQATLSLPVFQQADNAIVCLLQQPSRKAYLQSRGCSVFCCPPLCRTTVESVSDSLQSLDSLGRRLWSHSYPAHGPRHSHDSYLPHNQRQWLSLRLHKSWTGLS